MKVKITGWVHAIPPQSWEDKDAPVKWCFFSMKVSADGAYIPVSEAAFEVDVPDSWNVVAAQVEALEKQKRDALDAYQKKVSEINDRLAILQAICNEVTP